MKPSIARRLIMVAAVALAGCGSNSSPAENPSPGPGETPREKPKPGDSPVAPGSCGLDKPAFCETFDMPHPGGRGGEINEQIWSFARWPLWRAPADSFGKEYDQRGNLVIDENPSNPVPTFCGQRFSGIEPPNDVRVCSGQLNEVFNDRQGLPINSMRVRQPFDFTDRTGTVVFDVDAKRTSGSGFDGHTWWLELWITEDPTPIPYHGAPTIEAFTQRGALGFQVIPHGECFNDTNRNTISRVVHIRNNKIVRDEPIGGDECFQVKDTVLNRFKLLISKDKAEFWVSDADTPMNQRLIVSVDLDLDFSFGYLHLQHVHYNAAKTSNSAGQHPSMNQTFRWDNIGFDGPTYPAPRGYDVPDLMEPFDVSICGGCSERVHGGQTLGYFLGSNTNPGPPARFELPNVDLTNALSATLNFNVMSQRGEQIKYQFNSNPPKILTMPDFAQTGEDPDLGRAVTLDVPLTELVQGTNTLELEMVKENCCIGMEVGNIDLTVDVNR